MTNSICGTGRGSKWQEMGLPTGDEILGGEHIHMFIILM